MEDILYRQWNHQGTTTNVQLVVPRGNSPPSSKPPDSTQTIERVKQKFYWPLCRTDVLIGVLEIFSVFVEEVSDDMTTGWFAQIYCGSTDRENCDRYNGSIGSVWPRKQISARGNRLILQVARSLCPSCLTKKHKTYEVLVSEFVCRFSVSLQLHWDQRTKCSLMDWVDIKRTRTTLLHPQEFEQGELVWFYNPRRRKGKSVKLTQPWEGLSLLFKSLNDLVYTIRQDSRTVVPGNRLWKYHGHQ